MKFIQKLGGPCCSVPSRPKYFTTFQMLAKKLGGYYNNQKFYHSSNGLNWIEGQNSNGQTKAIVLANNDYLFQMNITNNVYSSSTDSISNNLNIEEYLGLLKQYSSIEYYYPSETLSLVGQEVYTQAIAPQGDVQIFANPECTEYATGVVNKVYARVNKPWGENEAWSIGSRIGNSFTAIGPNEEYPSDLYGIIAYADFASNDSEVPFEVGQVVKCSHGIDSIDVTDFDKVFSKPQ